jgi:branched-chain amino acid transport system permease protein
VLLLALAAWALCAALAVVCNTYWLTTLTSASCLAMACSGTALLYGRLGLVNLCQYSLVGVGGWAALRTHFAVQPGFLIELLTGGLVAAAVGVLCALPALRLRGLILAVVTLMIAGIFQVVLTVTGFPDGGSGLLGRTGGAGRRIMERPGFAASDAAYFLLVVTILIGCFMLIEWHVRGRPGRAWSTMRRDERLAESLGINVVKYRLWGFALSGFLAGLAGALLAVSVGSLDGRTFSAAQSILLFALAVVGGVESWLGAVAAGLLLRAMPSLLANLGFSGFVSMIVFGVGLIQALMTSPDGIAGSLARLRQRALRQWSERARVRS